MIMEARVAGVPPPQVEWLHNGAPLSYRYEAFDYCECVLTTRNYNYSRTDQDYFEME